MSSESIGASSPKMIYLDQSVYSTLLSKSRDWKATSLGKALVDARDRGLGQVWAGPTHVIELIQAEDKGLRRSLAAMILELIEGRRMWWGFEFELLDEYFRFLGGLVPGTVRHPEFFRHYGEIARRTWLGALALSAATDSEWLVPVVDDLRRTKTINQLIHARFAVDPDRWVREMREAAEQLNTTEDDPLADLESMTTEEMRWEIARLSKEAERLGNATTQKLNRDRAEIAAVYGAFEIGALLQNIFQLPLDLDLTLDVPLLIKHWDDNRMLQSEPLPTYIREMPENQWEGDPKVFKDVVQRTIRVAAKAHLPVLGIGYEVILREMQRNMNQRHLPTAGLAFDGDHASAINRHHIFMTFDDGLANALRAIVNKPKSQSGIEWNTTIVINEKQLMDALR